MGIAIYPMDIPVWPMGMSCMTIGQPMDSVVSPMGI
jgi:hypothetical protein